MRILITGICGFVGSTLARSLREYGEGIDICGIDNFSRKGSELNYSVLRSEGIDVRKGDVCRIGDLESVGAVDWLIDAAANPSVIAGVDGRTGPAELLNCNLVGTIPMLELCRLRNIPFTLLSTSRVYSIMDLRSIRLRENGNTFEPEAVQKVAGLSGAGISEAFSTVPPLSLYGVSKLCAENIALEYASAFGFPVWINRCGVMAGAGQFGKPDQGIFSYWIHSWVRRRPLKYLGFGGKGHQVRDCLHPRDLTSLLWQQLEAGSGVGRPPVINVSGGMESAISLAELSAWCSAKNGPHEVVSDGSNRAFDLPWVVLDNSTARQVWGWAPKTSRESIFEEILDKAEKNPAWLALSE